MNVKISETRNQHFSLPLSLLSLSKNKHIKLLLNLINTLIKCQTLFKTHHTYSHISFSQRSYVKYLLSLFNR